MQEENNEYKWYNSVAFNKRILQAITKIRGHDGIETDIPCPIPKHILLWTQSHIERPVLEERKPEPHILSDQYHHDTEAIST